MNDFKSNLTEPLREDIIYNDFIEGYSFANVESSNISIRNVSFLNIITVRNALLLSNTI